MGYWKNRESMGTATLTRSHGRKTRSASKAEGSDRSLSSPLESLQGNKLSFSSRKHIPRPSKPSNSIDAIEKENAVPATGDSSENVVNLSDDSAVKSLKKRKQCMSDVDGTSTHSHATVVDNEQQSSVMDDPQVDNTRGQQDTDVSVVLEVVPETSNVVITHRNDTNESNAERETVEIQTGNRGAPNIEKQTSTAKDNTIADSNALSLLQKDYEKLYKKYQKLKARKFDEVDALYAEQKSQINAFVRATEAMLEFYRTENTTLKKQIQEANLPELWERCQVLEKSNVDYRNDLLQEQTKSLELRQENKRLKSLLLEQAAEKQKNVESVSAPTAPTVTKSITTTQGTETITGSQSMLVQPLLENILGLQLSSTGDGTEEQLHCRHHPTGFSFKLRVVQDPDVAELVGGGQLMYENVSLGVCKKAADWMKDKEVIFGMDQAQLFFKKLITFFNRGAYG